MRYWYIFNVLRASTSRARGANRCEIRRQMPAGFFSPNSIGCRSSRASLQDHLVANKTVSMPNNNSRNLSVGLGIDSLHRTFFNRRTICTAQSESSLLVALA
jgi:hypothetical protein